jgi:type III secretory pathway component EscU
MNMNTEDKQLNSEKSQINYYATIFWLILCSFSFALMSLYFVYETQWIGANYLPLSNIAIFAVVWAFCLSLLQTPIGWILIIPMWWIFRKYKLDPLLMT